jgi:hypothetical protein
MSFHPTVPQGLDCHLNFRICPTTTLPDLSKLFAFTAPVTDPFSDSQDHQDLTRLLAGQASQDSLDVKKRKPQRRQTLTPPLNRRCRGSKRPTGRDNVCLESREYTRRR